MVGIRDNCQFANHPVVSQVGCLDDLATMEEPERNGKLSITDLGLNGEVAKSKR